MRLSHYAIFSEPQWFVHDGSIQFLSVLHHQLCLRELFFQGLGSGLGVPFTEIFFYVMCVYSIVYTKSTNFVIVPLNQPYRHLFALWLGTMFSSFTLSLPVFSCLQLRAPAADVLNVPNVKFLAHLAHQTQK